MEVSWNLLDSLSRQRYGVGKKFPPSDGTRTITRFVVSCYRLWDRAISQWSGGGFMAHLVRTGISLGGEPTRRPDSEPAGSQARQTSTNHARKKLVAGDAGFAGTSCSDRAFVVMGVEPSRLRSRLWRSLAEMGGEDIHWVLTGCGGNGFRESGAFPRYRRFKTEQSDLHKTNGPAPSGA